MEWVLMWVVGSAMVGVIAHEKGLEGLTYFLASLVLSPIVMGVMAVALPSKLVQKVVLADDADANKKTHGICPDCHGFVHLYAIKCKHCGCDLLKKKEEATIEEDAQAARKKVG